MTMTSGTYLPPADAVGWVLFRSASYDLQFIGPGLDCEDVTASSNFTEFMTSSGVNTTTFYEGQLQPQTDDMTMRISIQTWDLKRSAYQAINCTGVLRSYSVSISHATTSAINVTASRVLSVIHTNTSQLSAFSDTYLYNILVILVEPTISSIMSEAGASFQIGRKSADGELHVNSNTPYAMPFTVGGSIGTYLLDGSVTWNANLSLALEEFAQNTTLSLLSGQIFTFNPDDPEVLENVTTTCTYTFTAYKYTHLLVYLRRTASQLPSPSYGAIWGSVAIRWNGVEGSMDFSRILRGSLERKDVLCEGSSG